MIFLRFIPDEITDRWQTGTVWTLAAAELLLVDVPLAVLFIMYLFR